MSSYNSIQVLFWSITVKLAVDMDLGLNLGVFEDRRQI
jgi:hypothetical protein